MESHLIVGYAAAALMGATLGLFGGGGSILTLPILVYIFRIDPVQATAYSLFVVGVTSVIGAGGYLYRRLVDFGLVLTFGLPCLVTVFLTRRFIVPAIPDVLWQSPSFTLEKGALIMLLFAVLMVLAAGSMLRGRSETTAASPTAISHGNRLLALGEGLSVGCVTGIVGVGGGFLIVPALVMLMRVPIRVAIGTSLVVIATKSLCGFVGDLTLSRTMDWPFLVAFSAAAIVGMLFGLKLNQWLPAERLKPAFGWFVLLAGALVLLRELVW